MDFFHLFLIVLLLVALYLGHQEREGRLRLRGELADLYAREACERGLRGREGWVWDIERDGWKYVYKEWECLLTRSDARTWYYEWAYMGNENYDDEMDWPAGYMSSAWEAMVFCETYVEQIKRMEARA